MKQTILIFMVLMLAACSNQEPIESLITLPMPEGLQYYDGPEETVFDRVMLNLIQVWDQDVPRLDLAYYWLPEESNLQIAETLTAYFTEHLSPLGWTLDKENSFTDVHIVFSRDSRIGVQNLVLTRIPLPAKDEANIYIEGAVLMVTLSPVPKG